MSNDISMNEPKNQLSQTEKSVTPWGARILDVLAGRPRSKLAEEIGLKTGTLNDIISKSMPNAEFAIRIARALKVSVEWLINGEDAAPAGRAAEGGEWVLVPFFSFDDVPKPGETAEAKPREIPVRRAWLDRLGPPRGTWWATEMPMDGLRGLADRGDLLICDYPPDHLREGQNYIFMLFSTRIVRRAVMTPDGIALMGEDGNLVPTPLPPGKTYNDLPNVTCLGRIAAVYKMVAV